MYNVYNLNDIFVFTTDDIEIAKKEVRKYGGTIKNENDEVVFEVTEEEKKSSSI